MFDELKEVRYFKEITDFKAFLSFFVNILSGLLFSQ